MSAVSIFQLNCRFNHRKTSFPTHSLANEDNFNLLMVQVGKNYHSKRIKIPYVWYFLTFLWSNFTNFIEKTKQIWKKIKYTEDHQFQLVKDFFIIIFDTSTLNLSRSIWVKSHSNHGFCRGTYHLQYYFPADLESAMKIMFRSHNVESTWC
jgi:hypothetical protein